MLLFGLLPIRRQKLPMMWGDGVMKRSWLWLFGLVCLCAFTSAACDTATISMRGGETISGIIKESDADSITVEVPPSFADQFTNEPGFTFTTEEPTSRMVEVA